MAVDVGMQMITACRFMFKDPSYMFIYRMTYFEPELDDIESYIGIVKTVPIGF